MLDIRACETDTDFSLALQLTRDYLAWLKLDLSFQDIDTELANLPAMYGLPKGCFFLARQNGEVAGGVGLRMLEPEVCEMKRLFVYDPFKRKGVGYGLCTALIQTGCNLGYKKMRLDTLGHMKAAISLYNRLGFKEIDAYRFNPDPTATYMELRL